MITERTLPQVGTMAPLFKGFTHNGENLELKQLRGGKVALYFYPQDDTPTCTTQACNLRDNFAALQKAGITIIGISPDGARKHQKFISKYALPFTLIADEGELIARKYGVWGPKTFMGRDYIGLHRTTFLINEKGRLVHIIEKPVSKNHAAQILEGFKLLRR